MRNRFYEKAMRQKKWIFAVIKLYADFSKIIIGTSNFIGYCTMEDWDEFNFSG